MNFHQRNPQDSKHNEFHDGEYEYWPLDGGLKSKSISIPAAVVSGLELLAAAAAAGLLALALSVLYVISAPLAIEEHSALINVNVYNNTDAHQIVYTLSPAADPERILEQDVLEEAQETLHFGNLRSGTEYLLIYYNADHAEWEQIGQFRFRTPGQQDPSDIHIPPSAPVEPVYEPTTDTEPNSETEPATVETTEEPTVETTEEPTETTEHKPPVYYHPAPRPDPAPQLPITPTEPDAEVTEPTEPATEPSTEPEPEETEPDDRPAIGIGEPDFDRIVYVEPDCGDEVDAYFQITEYHNFMNVPEGEYEIEITQGDLALEEFSHMLSSDGNLSVSFTGGLLPAGRATTTTVTLIIGNDRYVSTQTVFPPSLESVDMTMTQNADGTYTFTAFANVLTDGNQEMNCEATFYPTMDMDAVTLSMHSESPERYTASYITMVPESDEEQEAAVFITAFWSRTDPGVYQQSDWYSITFLP